MKRDLSQRRKEMRLSLTGQAKPPAESLTIGEWGRGGGHTYPGGRNLLLWATSRS
jgi:hypothetical protein